MGFHSVKESPSRDVLIKVPKDPKRALLPRFKSLEKAAHAAMYYGFSPLTATQIDKHDVAAAKQFKEPNGNEGSLELFRVGEKIHLLRAFAEKKLGSLPQPAMIFYESHIPHEKEGRKAPERKIMLDILGSQKSIADALLIQTAYTILKEEHIKDLVVEINSLGDRESAARFAREFTNYYKKHFHELSTSERQLFKKEPLALLACQSEKCKELSRFAPEPISFLSEQSRRHFKEVLEFLEALDIPYRISKELVADKNYCSETVFVIRPAGTTSLVAPYAIGRRYTSLSRKIGLKKEVPAAGVAIHLEKAKMEPLHSTTVPAKKPRLYFIQIGFEARRKSIKVIEMLRVAKIPLTYNLIKDKFIGQLSSAEEVHAPYLLIMGQKESMEESVLVRTMKNLSQETVAISELVTYIKKLK